ncbi:MAG: CRISPR-associated endonuclease Cas1 [Myxococcales bacterium]|nr:CRISPR-associated endonuclease Cas1 [Myxococcales bacterium]
MLNEFTYCPRLFHLEWVQGEFADNELTVEGRASHRRVDGRAQELPAAEEQKPFEARSVSLSSERLGLSAKIDIVEGESGTVVAVDYKRGRPPSNGLLAHEPEQVQLCAYALLLREQGYRCEEGVLYYVQARQRVAIPIGEELVGRTLALLAEAREASKRSAAPPPLKGSPKCQGCSLHGICLPDETNHLREEQSGPIRRLVPARDDATPLYVTSQGARVGLEGERLLVRDREGVQLAEARLMELSQLVLFGNVQVSSQAIRELCERAIPVCWLSYGGWLSGLVDGLGHNNVEIRRRQYRLADDEAKALELARRFVRNKIANCRTLLRRNHREAPEAALRELSSLVERAGAAAGLPELLGIEGNAARIYFGHFSGMLRAPAESLAFDFETRTRRPPKDPVNALLSLAYALLAKDVAIAARGVGLDPFLGFYHQPRHGRPALALDLMEEFRPLIADSVVLSAINTGVVPAGGFVRSGLGVALKAEARRDFLKAYQRRMDEEVTHPVFGYRISYRRVLEVQCRLFARHLLGELAAYPEFRTR